MRPSRVARRCAAAALGLVLGGAGASPLSRAPADDPAFAEGVPRMVSAATQLAYARGVKRSLAKEEGEERARRRALAIEAYRAVYRFHPRACDLGAEAAFRAGELLRAGNRPRDALREFTRAAALGPRTPFHARARLEIGHLHRREGRWKKALDSYLQVAAEAHAAAEYRDDAWLWAGCMWKELGRVDDARRVWRTMAEDAESPLDRILAFDHLVETWIDAGDLEAAAGVLDECVAAHSELALEETRTGERVRRALSGMRCVTNLQRAIATRASDARKKRSTRRDRSHRLLPRASHSRSGGRGALHPDDRRGSVFRR